MGMPLLDARDRQAHGLRAVDLLEAAHDEVAARQVLVVPDEDRVDEGAPGRADDGDRLRRGMATQPAVMATPVQPSTSYLLLASAAAAAGYAGIALLKEPSEFALFLLLTSYAMATASTGPVASAADLGARAEGFEA